MKPCDGDFYFDAQFSGDDIFASSSQKGKRVRENVLESFGGNGEKRNIHLIYPPPRMPVRNEGLVRDPQAIPSLKMY